jgi:hypothetical protein
MFNDCRRDCENAFQDTITSFLTFYLGHTFQPHHDLTLSGLPRNNYAHFQAISPAGHAFGAITEPITSICAQVVCNYECIPGFPNVYPSYTEWGLIWGKEVNIQVTLEETYLLIYGSNP